MALPEVVPREQWLQARLRWPDVLRSLAEAMDLPVVGEGAEPGKGPVCGRNIFLPCAIIAA